MSSYLTIDQLLKKKLVPAKGARRSGPNKDRYNLDNTEEAVFPPFYAPLKKAATFYSKNSNKPRFRYSESEPTYSKAKLLNEFGVISVEGVEPYTEVYSQSLRSNYYLYRLSDFNLSNVKELEFEQWYAKLKDQLSGGYGSIDTKIHTAANFSIFVTANNIKIELSKLKLRVICKIQLKAHCKSNIKISGSNPKKDFRTQVILPLANSVEQFHDKLSKILPTVICEKHRVVEVKSIDFADVKVSLDELVDNLESERAQQATYAALMSEKPYHELFPCRDIKRSITLYIGPTNSGKTFQACQTIKQVIQEQPSAKACCLFPLRALAAQLKDDFMASDTVCSLITGEEREIEPGARVTCCTTETMDPGRYHDIMFIDECQLIFDDNKQAAYTRAILGAYCQELILAVAPYYADALIKLLEQYTDDTIKVVKLERLCPLGYCGRLTFDNVQKGDVIVAYRVKSIHVIAGVLRKKGFKVGVIYGRMSPSARRTMIKEFMLSDCDCLVATDAIGMGLSIPARRILIAEGTKFDGTCVRNLNQEEIRQVAGRAGRFGFYDKGYAGALDVSYLIPDSVGIDEGQINYAISTIDSFSASDSLKVSPDKHVVKSASELNLVTTLHVWNQSVSSHNNIEIASSTFDELLDKAKFLDGIELVDRNLLVEFLFIVFLDDRDGTWRGIYTKMVAKVIKSEQLTLDGFSKLYQYRVTDNFVRLENKSIYLTLLSQFQRILPTLCPDEYIIMDAQELVGSSLAKALLERYTGNRSIGRKRKKKHPRKDEQGLVYHEKIWLRVKDKIKAGHNDYKVIRYIQSAMEVEGSKSDFLALAAKEAHPLTPQIKQLFATVK